MRRCCMSFIKMICTAAYSTSACTHAQVTHLKSCHVWLRLHGMLLQMLARSSDLCVLEECACDGWPQLSAVCTGFSVLLTLHCNNLMFV